MTDSFLVINADGPETRVALVEDGLLAELYIERKQERGIAGNIYKGRVERVLPGMQAAFVNIGLEKSAYLHVSDVRGDARRLQAPGSRRGTRARRAEDGDDETSREAPPGGARIEDLLKEGQEIARPGDQGAHQHQGRARHRATSRCPAATWCSCLPSNHVGISRRISSDKERRRLREIIDQMRPQGTGFIVRTVAENVPEKDLRADMDFLIKLWNDDRSSAPRTARCPALIYNDLDLLLRTVRDMFTPEVDKLIIDSRAGIRRASRSSSRRSCRTSPGRSSSTTGAEPIFDGYGIEIEIDRALERKVWLKSGGYLIVDEMEALTAIDVNTGRFVGKKNLEDTITQTNLEACARGRRAAAHPLHRRHDRRRLHRHGPRVQPRQGHARLQRCTCAATGPRPAVTRISELGLVEMTRKRTRESLLHAPDRALRTLRGQGLHQVAANRGLRAAARAPAAGQPDRRGHGARRGAP